MSPNPLNAVKITNYNTKHTANTKIHFHKSKVFETDRKNENERFFKKIKLLFYYISRIDYLVRHYRVKGYYA